MSELREKIARLKPEQIADIEAHIDGLTIADTKPYERPAHGWTCFHCGETFNTQRGARLHFGEEVTGRPVCVPSHAAIKAAIKANVKMEWRGGYGTIKYLDFTEAGLDKAASAILALPQLASVGRDSSSQSDEEVGS